VKARVEVVGVSVDGGSLVVDLEGGSDPSYLFRRLRHSVRLPNTATNRRAYAVGRELDLEVKPR
jgi:hypothetical protein